MTRPHHVYIVKIDLKHKGKIIYYLLKDKR